LFEALIVGNLAGGGIGGSQIVEEVGHYDEENELSISDAVVGYSRCQVSFTTAIAPFENQPPCRFLGEVFSPLVGSPEILSLLGVESDALRLKALKGHAGKLAQLAQVLQVRKTPGLQFLDLALTGIELAEIGMARWHVLDQVPSPVADGAHFAGL
jgi:hypothetical protein